MACYEDLRALYAATAKERDELRRIVEKQSRMNRVLTNTALALDNVTAQRDALLDEIRGMCNLCKHYASGDGDAACPMCAWDSRFEWRGLEGKDG